MDNLKMPPYSQHYRCAKELFGDSRIGCVFEYLFDEYLYQMRQNKGGIVKFSKQQIELKTGVNRHGLGTILQKLEDLGVIRLADNSCEIIADYFMSVISIFSYAKGEERKIIKSAFLSHNTVILQNCGLTTCNTEAEVVRLSDGIISMAENARSIMPGQLCQAENAMLNLPNSTKLEENAILNRFLDEYHSFFKLDEHKINTQLDNDMAEYASYIAKGIENLTPKEKLAFSATLIRIGTMYATIQTGRICHNDWQNMPVGVAEYATRNININKKENELNERSEFSSIVGVEKDKEGMGEEGKDEGGFEGLEIIELKSPISEEERYSQYKKEKPYINVYRNKPYFSERDMEKITGDLYECTKSPVKLFIYNLWGGLYEWYQEEIEDKLPVDEYGEPLKNDSEKSDLDMLRSIISQTMFARIVKQAWYETEGQIESKMFQTENENVPIEIEELPDIHLENLIDWKEAVNENGEHGFVVSLEGFRNIEADDVTEVKQPKSREEKKAMNRINRQFLAAVMTTDDSQLTPIEALIKDFTSKFIILDEHYHVEGFANGRGDRMDCSFLPGYLIKPWVVKVLEFGFKPEEFYETFNLPEYKDGSNLHMAATIFSYQKVQRCNEMRGFQSIISEETLRNAPILDD